MLGAIIGDLAAWTWKNDHEKFYPKLISDDAQLSDIGRAVLASFNLQPSHLPSVEWNTILNSISASMRSSCMSPREVNDEWEDFLGGTARFIPPSVKSTMNIVNTIVAGWFECPKENAYAWVERFHSGKESFYFTQVAEIIYKLRHGATKADAIKDTAFIVDWNDHHEKEPHFVSPLFYACKAWKCFYYAFDYTSAIHNAVRCSCNYPHILAVITGAFAEAMYGCEFMLLKEKYQPNAICQELRIPERINNLCKQQFDEIRQYELNNRYFFPKNSARTNVELHRWTDIENPWKEYVIDENTYHIILKAFYPDWEHRNQLYLDNGWVYCCRSNVVLCRFQLIKQADGSYRISNLQKSEDRYRYMWGLPDALYNVNVRGIMFPLAMDKCKYYQGELKNPYHNNTAESNFWHDEMMLCMTEQDLEYWKSEMKAPIFAIDRLRMGTDGPGVTTLVTFMGCPLHCRYCINPKCHEPIYESDGKTLREGIMMLSPQELYDRVKMDNIYFQATGGGVCFGGGEPGLHAEFIEEFRKLCGDRWKINIETSGCFGWTVYKRLAPVIDLWIVDIKTLNGDVYQEYTGDLSGVRQYLGCLKRLVDLDKVIIKIPHIPDFTSEDDVKSGIEEVRKLGFKRIQEIRYIKRVTLKKNSHERKR